MLACWQGRIITLETEDNSHVIPRGSLYKANTPTLGTRIRCAWCAARSCSRMMGKAAPRMPELRCYLSPLTAAP